MLSRPVSSTDVAHGRDDDEANERAVSMQEAADLAEAEIVAALSVLPEPLPDGNVCPVQTAERLDFSMPGLEPFANQTGRSVADASEEAKKALLAVLAATTFAGMDLEYVACKLIVCCSGRFQERLAMFIVPMPLSLNDAL